MIGRFLCALILAWVGYATEPLYGQSGKHGEHSEHVVRIGQQEDWETQLTESGKFQLHFVRTGPNAVPDTDENQSGVPDFIEAMMSYADSTYRFLIQTLAYPDFTEPQHPYPIYFRDLPYLGFTGVTEGGSHIILHRNFEEIRQDNEVHPPPENSDPDGHTIGTMKITMAHEIMHAIQYFVLESFPEVAWLEMDAVMSSHFVFPNVRDYLNDIRHQNSIFLFPEQSTPIAYHHASLMMYFAEQFGLQFWAHIWNLRQQQPSLDMISAIREHLETQQRSWNTEFLELHLWHFASGARHIPEFGFAHAADYPLSKITQRFTAIPEQITNIRSVNTQAAHYFLLENGTEKEGAIRISFFAEHPDMGLGVVRYAADGAHIYRPEIPENGILHVALPALWEQTDSLGVIITNPFSDQRKSYQLLTGAGSEISKLVLGDVLQTETLTRQDAQHILDYATFSEEIRLAARFQGDVSGDGTLSPLDAHLILAQTEGLLDWFPVDEDQDGFGPDDMLFDPHFSPPFLLPEPEQPISFEFEFADEITVNEQATIFLRLRDVEADIFGGILDISFENVAHIISCTSLLADMSFSWNTTEQNVWISFASASRLPSGFLLECDVAPESPGVLRMSGRGGYLNEWEKVSPDWQNEVQIQVLPSLPVSAQTETPGTVRLHQNFPNPFNPVTHIGFELSQPEFVRLYIYDITGRKIKTIHEGHLPEGSHRFVFNGEHLASGVYIYRLYTHSGSFQRTLLLQK